MCLPNVKPSSGVHCDFVLTIPGTTGHAISCRLSFGDVLLGVGITAAAGIPAFQLGASLYLGDACFLQDNATKKWSRNPSFDGCVSAVAYVGFHPTDPTQMFVYAAFEGFTVSNIVNTFMPDCGWCKTGMPQAVKDSGFPNVMKDGTNGSNPKFSYSGSPAGTVTDTGLTIPGGVAMKGEVGGRFLCMLQLRLWVLCCSMQVRWSPPGSQLTSSTGMIACFLGQHPRLHDPVGIYREPIPTSEGAFGDGPH